MKSLYEILGLSAVCTQDQIKKNYRHLAMKYHPDRNNGDNSYVEKFKEVSAAYETLGDPKKRSDYDFLCGISKTTTESPFKHPGDFYDFNRMRQPPIYNKNYTHPTGSSYANQDRKKKKGRNVEKYIDISIYEAINGWGRILSEYADITVVSNINDPRQDIVLQGLGKEGGNGGEKGDLYIKTRIKSKLFTSDWRGDLIYKMKIDIWDFFTGCTRTVEEDGYSFTVEIPAGSWSKTITLKESGLKTLSRSGLMTRGDLIVKVAVRKPDINCGMAKRLIKFFSEEK